MQMTQNAIVDAMAKIRVTGNIIPAQWYKTITRATGKPYLAAIVILADIVYWYRPAELRDETTGAVVGYRKRFKADLLQRSYAQIAEQFGISKKEATTAITHLESLGVVRKHFRTLEIGGVRMSNVLFIELVPPALAALTFDDTYHPQGAEGMYRKGDTLSPAGETPRPAAGDTNTYINPKTNNIDNNGERHTPTAQPSEDAPRNNDLARHAETKAQINSDFEMCWAEYPKKEGKQKARRAFERALRSGKFTTALILAEVVLYRQHCERRIRDGDLERRYIPTGGAWFDDERWRDETPSISSSFDDFVAASNHNRAVAEIRRSAARGDLPRVREIMGQLPY